MGVEQETSLVVYEFDTVLQAEIVADKKLYNETNPYYGVYRALKETLRSESVNKMQLGYADFYSVAHFLLEDEVTNHAFREWIKTRSFEWENGWLPKNARRLYVVGKQEILRRDGKKRKQKEI